VLIDPATDRLAGGVLGSVTATGTVVGGSGTMYAANGYSFANGSTVAPFTISGGTVTARSSIAFTASAAGQSYAISASYDPLYDRGASLANVAAVYRGTLIAGVAASFSINATGMLFAQATNGCVANGQVSVIDSRYNGYNVTVTISSCVGLNGTYSGLGVTLDADGANNMFLFGVFNATGGFVGSPSK